MVRGKTQMKRIENATSRQVTFSKRRNGLLKKADELSLLCDVEVGLVVFSPSGKLYEFASSSMQNILERYEKCSEECRASNTIKEKGIEEKDIECLKREIENIKERVGILQSTERKMLGECLASCSMKELNMLESQVKRGLSQIRAKKTEIFEDQIEQIEQLKRKCIDANDSTAPSIGLRTLPHIEVHTELVMRPPNGTISSANIAIKE